MKKLFALAILTIMVAGVVSCGPAAAPIPEPTVPPATATPVPYNLNVVINNSEKQPVSGAEVKIDSVAMTTDGGGVATFQNLSNPSAAINVKASGYKIFSVDQTLQPGENKLEISLETDPAGLLVENACAPNEKLLYIDDFQDKLANGWDQIEGNAPGWSIEPDSGNSENLVVAAKEGAPWTWLGGRDTYKFQNTVWRLKYKSPGSGITQFNFRFVESPDTSTRYIFAIGGDFANLGRLDQSNNHVNLGNTAVPAKNLWHLLEFAYFDGEVSVYIDGKKGVSWKEPNPWQGGTVNIEPNLKGDEKFYYDDISVCELTSPFQPIPKPKTGRNLTVILSAEDGIPITSARIAIAEIGSSNEAEKVVGETGKVSWNDLPGKEVTLQISAPGYLPKKESVTIEKGDNQSNLVLERDTNSKLPSELCQTGETLSYFEDMQDKSMQGWPALSSAIEMGAPGWSIVEDAEKPGNFVLKVERIGENSNTGNMNYEKEKFADAVVRFSAKATSAVHYIISWHMTNNYEFNGETYDNGQYLAFIYADQARGGRVEKVLEKSGNRTGVPVINWNKNLQDGKWHNFEISTFQGEYQIWIDGKLAGKWVDTNPIPEGYFAIANDFWKADASAIYDNFAVCKLYEPFVSIFTKK
jgi:hypothetical protein